MLAREFPDKAISKQLVKILTVRKIPYLETGNADGRYLITSIALTALTGLFVGGYLALMYYSKEFQAFETSSIAALAAICLITYIYAICIKPDYAQLPEEKTEEQFFNLLKTLVNQPSKKICAYCQIEKPDKARHCFICGRCCLEHDSHCFLLNNCVGKGNRGFVIAYLFSTSMLLSTIVFSAIFHMTNVINPKEEKEDMVFFNKFIWVTFVMAQAMALIFGYYLMFYIRKLFKIRKYKSKKK